jgi:hypothetical protein
MSVGTLPVALCQELFMLCCVFLSCYAGFLYAYCYVECQLDTLSTWHFVNLTLGQLETVNLTLGQLDTWPT